MSTTRRLYLLLIPIALLFAMVASIAAAASPPTSASGTFTYTSSTLNVERVAGGNTIIHVTATVAYTGTLSGTSVLEGTLIVHADGSANFHDVETFTGTVNGVPGTVTFRLTGRNDSSLAMRATATIVRASGGLAGLHGVLHEAGTVVIPTGPVGTYSGQVG